MKQFVIPAILPKSLEDLNDYVQRTQDVVSYVQIDIVDGIFVPDVSWPFLDGGTLKDAVDHLNNLTTSFELDLMIQNPEESLDLLLETDVRRCIIHLTSTRYLKQCIASVQSAGREAYIGVGIEDNMNDVAEIIHLVDGVQCMGISHIGRQGELYDRRVEGVVKKIKAFRSDVRVVVDGGVSKNSIPSLVDAGVSQVAVGSALFNGSVAENFAFLEGVASC